MSKQMTLEEVAKLAASTKDAYSFERYENWTDCALALAIAGFTYAEAETMLRSKNMRWAGDHSNKAYGKVTAADMLAFIGTPAGARATARKLMRA